jgi:hypothetical protein
MPNPALEPVLTLETLVARRVCTSVLATGADGVVHWVQGAEISTSEFPRGTVHHFGPVAFLEDDIVLSQFDHDTGVIVLIMADGTAATIEIVAQDAIVLL